MISKYKCITLFLLTALTAEAADLRSRVSTLETQMNAISTKTAEGSIGAKTASASPQILGMDWFLSADLLFWHANEGGTDYAVLFKNAPYGSTAKAHTHTLNFGWDVGFRAGIGTYLNHDQWDLYANFTQFQTDKSSSTSLHDGAFIIPLLGPILGDSRNQASQVKIGGNIVFYNLDFNLGRHYFVSRKLAFHPFIGIKSAWIAQHIHTQASLVSPTTDVLHLNIKNDFWGIGPTLGIDGKWFMSHHFNLFGSIAGSLLWGTFDVHEKQRLQNRDQITFNVPFDRDLIVPTTQMQIGFGYETNLFSNRYHLGINLRYEYQYWWQQNQMPYFPEPGTFKYKCSSEDLSLEGLTLDVRCDF